MNASGISICSAYKCFKCYKVWIQCINTNGILISIGSEFQRNGRTKVRPSTIRSPRWCVESLLPARFQPSFASSARISFQLTVRHSLQIAGQKPDVVELKHFLQDSIMNSNGNTQQFSLYGVHKLSLAASRQQQ